MDSSPLVASKVIRAANYTPSNVTTLPLRRLASLVASFTRPSLSQLPLREHIVLVWGRIKYAATLHGVYDFVLFCLHFALAGEGSALDDLRVVICAASGLLVLCFGLFCYVAIASRADRGREKDEFSVPLMMMEEGRSRVDGDLVIREEEEDQRVR